MIRANSRLRMRTSSRARKTPQKSLMTLAAIVILYLACNTPRLLLNCMEYHYLSIIMDMDFCQCSKHINWFELLLLINHLFLVINSSANFLIYASVSTIFKNGLLLKVRLLRRKSLKTCNSKIEERSSFQKYQLSGLETQLLELHQQ